MNTKIKDFIHKLSHEIDTDALELSESSKLDHLAMAKIKKMSDVFYPYWIKIIQNNEDIDQNGIEFVKINKLLNSSLHLKKQCDESKIIFQEKTLREIERMNQILGFNVIENEELDQIKVVFTDENQPAREIISFLTNDKMASSLCKLFNNDLLKQKLNMIGT